MDIQCHNELEFDDKYYDDILSSLHNCFTI
jgi:hypothetical protein